MGFHELVTNAAKYGALTDGGGTISVVWELRGDGPDAEFDLTWSEDCAVSTPSVTYTGGFGSKVLMKLVPAALNGLSFREMRPRGFLWRLTAPLSGIAEGSAAVGEP